MRSVLTSLIAGAACAAYAQAPISGSKTVTLSNPAGERVEIGTVVFEPIDAERSRFSFSLDQTRFGEYFLAMRPFKCLAGPRQHLCHFPFTRNVEAVISRSDLQPLEYALMFMHKKPGVLNLDSRNGAYYRLRFGERGIEGTLFDVDMEPIIVPDSVPADQRMRPIRHDMLEAADTNSHWLPRLTIE